MKLIETAKEIMIQFATDTGLLTIEKPPRRYLWTDAFAVCNFLELYRQTGDETWKESALKLVDQVHSILGRHREDDPRTGWISGLSEEEGKKHPTRGGLRIGKSMNERKPSELYDESLEWERDGQYYHYLTRWIHALNRTSRITNERVYNRWAAELAKSAHSGFVRKMPNGSKQLYWKMSIDLSYPLVPFMGQHDPLDGWVTYSQTKATAEDVALDEIPSLDSEIAEMAEIFSKKNLMTTDPLGIGGLLCDAFKIAQLIIRKGFSNNLLLGDLLEASLSGLKAYSADFSLDSPPEYRLAFRELGVAIGLHAFERLEMFIENNPEKIFEGLQSQLNGLKNYTGLCEKIESFWLKTYNRKAKSWTDLRDINRVMLATSLIPDGYINL